MFANYSYEKFYFLFNSYPYPIFKKIQKILLYNMTVKALNRTLKLSFNELNLILFNIFTVLVRKLGNVNEIK